MTEFKDKKGIVVQDGDIIDLHQTVNGRNIFLVKTVNPLDIRYGYDHNIKYEYDQESLLSPDILCGVTEFEIVSNLKN